MSNSDYLEQYKILHKRGGYGMSSTREDLFEIIERVVEKEKPSSILDYGCGQSTLMDVLSEKEYVENVYKYDPAVEKYNCLSLHKQDVDLVICTDVLEHIPREFLYSVVHKIRTDGSRKVFFSIGVTEASMILPNGENAHCTIMPKDWWLAYLEGVFGKVTVVGELRAKFQCVTW